MTLFNSYEEVREAIEGARKLHTVLGELRNKYRGGKKLPGLKELPYCETLDWEDFITDSEPVTHILATGEQHYGSGNTDYYSAYIPIQFFYDEHYEVLYRAEYEEKEKLQKLREEAERLAFKERTIKAVEEFDRKEYERLKEKYENS